MDKLTLTLLFLVLFTKIIVHGQSSSYHVNTIAGTYPFNYNGDGIDAKLAQLAVPDGIALSPSNNDLFIVDSVNDRVRKVSNSIITTVAGSGFFGFLNTSVASMAHLANPRGIAFQNNDTFFLSNGYNVIFKITLSSDSISIFAGQFGKARQSWMSYEEGRAVDGLLNTPSGLAFWNDRLFIVENDRISVVSTVDGMLSRFAGGGTDTSDIVQDAKNATLAPLSVAISPITGEVYIGEKGKIRKILNNGTIVVLYSTFDITGSSVLSECLGMAVSQLTDALYVSLSGNGVFMIQSNGTISKLTPTVSATIPRGIAISPSGEVFFVDSYKNQVLKITTNNVEIVAGIGGPSGYSIDNIAALNARLSEPESVAVAPNNEIIVAETRNNRLRRISIDGIITTILESTSVRSPLVPKDGEYYFVNSLTVNYFKSEVIPQAEPGSLTSPKGVARAKNGDLFITDSGTGEIRKIFANNGTIITIAGGGTLTEDNILATNAKLNQPYGIVLTSSGEVIFSEYEGHRVRKILNNGTLITIAGTGEQGYSGENLEGINSKLNSPAGIYILSNDELLICDSKNHVIRKLFKNGTLTTIAGTATIPGYNGENTLPLEAQFYEPMGVGVSATESILYIADTKNGKVRVLSFGCDLQNQCSGNGDCIKNNCSCYTGWRGSADCSVYSCETLNGCSGHGTCVSNNTCSCSTGWIESLNCSVPSCDALNNCSGLGSCVGPNLCACNIGWKGSLNCSLPSCETLNDCSGHGDCVSNSSCLCKSGWVGINCSLPSCENLNNCSGHGSCVGPNTCSCSTGWRGSLNCSLYSCETLNSCSGHGECVSNGTCICNNGWKASPDCSVPTCEMLNNCSGHVSPLVSKSKLIKSDNSNIGLIIGLVVGLTLLLILIVVAVIITIIAIMKLKKKNDNSLISIEEPIEMISIVDENVTQTPNTSVQLVSDFPTDTFSGNTYNILNSNTTSSPPPAQNSDHSMLKDRYKIQQVIGAGSFGKCYLCLDSKKNDMPVAIKTISYDQSRQAKIIDECSKTLSYIHPNLVEVYEFFESQIIQSICIVMKYYQGDLEHALKDLKQNGKIVSEKLIISIMKQIGDGLNYLHQEKLIIHRDIKPRNIFYSKLDTELDEIQVVIGDYGEAKETGETQNSVAGTLQYMAPEVFSRKYSYSADIFSLGVSLIQAMANETLDVNITAQLLYNKEDVVMERTLEHLISRGYSEKLCNFVMSMIAKDPNMRPSSADIQQFA